MEKLVIQTGNTVAFRYSNTGGQVGCFDWAISFENSPFNPYNGQCLAIQISLVSTVPFGLQKTQGSESGQG